MLHSAGILRALRRLDSNDGSGKYDKPSVFRILSAEHDSGSGTKEHFGPARQSVGSGKNASALVKKGIGKQAVACLARVTPIRKAAWSGASNRPRPSEQYQTMGVQGSISELKPKEIMLVDDIVTRGATFLGAANRLVEAFPEARIRAFAAMRTISNSSEFEALYEPVSGTITYREDRDDSIRRP